MQIVRPLTTSVVRCIMADLSYPPFLYVQMSDCGRHIRKWSRTEFEGCAGYMQIRGGEVMPRAVLERMATPHPHKGAI